MSTGKAARLTIAQHGHTRGMGRQRSVEMFCEGQCATLTTRLLPAQSGEAQHRLPIKATSLFGWVACAAEGDPKAAARPCWPGRRAPFCGDFKDTRRSFSERRISPRGVGGVRLGPQARANAFNPLWLRPGGFRKLKRRLKYSQSRSRPCLFHRWTFRFRAITTPHRCLGAGRIWGGKIQR